MLFGFIIVAIFVFYYYINPKMNVFNSIKANKELFDLLTELQGFKHYDTYNYTKFNKYIQVFFNVYLKVHDYETNGSVLFNKLKKLKSKSIKYLNRIPFNLDNDLQKSQKLYNIIYNINDMLESFLFQASYKLNVFYNSANKFKVKNVLL